jgi:hypothetical protein
VNYLYLSAILKIKHFDSQEALKPEDGGSMSLQNAGIQQCHYTALQARRSQLEWK